MLRVPVGHCVSACELCVSNVNIFNNQSEWTLTKREEQGLDMILLWWPGCRGTLKGLGQHLLSTIIDLVQYCNKQSDV